MIQISPADVSHDLARRAHYGTSMVPDERADQAVDSYVRHMREVVDEFSAWATDTNRAEMAADLERYRDGYVKKLHAYWKAHSNVMSTMITGPANFPVARNRKRGDTADRRCNEWLDWSKDTLKRLRRKYDPARIARAPIHIGEDGAVAKLREKLAGLERLQALMKAANKVCRAKKLTDEEKVERLVALDGITEAVARELLVPDAGRIGFPSYELSNNNASIRRLRKRVQAAEAEEARRESTPDEYYVNGVLVEEDVDDNRLRICFDEKPSAEMRTRLKSRGFRWSPRNVAWQRQLTENARRDARWVLKSLPPLLTETVPNNDNPCQRI
jgi:hypothetical protein